MRKLLMTVALATPMFVLVASRAMADEGMWLPLLIQQNYEEMKKRGLKLTPEDIYSVNNASLKDAIVKFGTGFCTGELISGEGLILTNHHCGYGFIQMHSTLENDILSNGFWAKTKNDEIPNPGLSISILQRMEDVTSVVLQGITLTTPEKERNEKIRAAVEKLEKENKKESYHTVNIKEFFDGNAYYMMVYNTYPDVRLVGTPPNSIGKFGGDTDNWMWPRHTGDFCLFRVYTAADGSPAAYSKDNIPMKPKHFLPISLKGIKENDYAMVMGFPGSTNRFLTSFGVQFSIDVSNPAIVKLRDNRLAVWRNQMKQDKKVKLQYAAKYARVANYWKYFQGQTEQLQRNKVADLKRGQEAAFTTWVKSDADRNKLYGNALSTLEKNYAGRKEYALQATYFSESILAVELLLQYGRLVGIEKMLQEGKDIKAPLEGFSKSLAEFYKDYDVTTDRLLFAVMLRLYAEDMPMEAHPTQLKNSLKKYKNNYEKWANDIYAKSIVADRARFDQFVKNPTLKALQADPALQLFKGFQEHYTTNLIPKLTESGNEAKAANRLYVAGTLEMNKDKKYYPNANSTLRITYGQVLPYEARDAVNYHYITTEKGILQKEIPGDGEFDVPAKLKELFMQKKFGVYGEGTMLPVNFLSNNDITGGNSGSPVINAEGHLIGTAFDGNWEAMSGDISFEPVVQRTISVDIRYTLFVIDSFGNAKHLIDEMKIIR
jgi:hypothetical protein